MRGEENLPENRAIRDRLRSFRSELKNNPTPAELKLRFELKKLNLRVQSQRIFFSTDFQCIVDFYFRTDNSNIVIEIDGGYHDKDSQQKKDLYRSRWLKSKRKCSVIRFTNDRILNDTENCIKEIAQFYINNAVHSVSRNFNIFRGVLGLPPVPKQRFVYYRK